MKRPRQLSRPAASVILGGAAAAVIVSAYVAGLAQRGREDVVTGLLYNGPIAFVFLSLAAEGVLYAFEVGPRRALRERATIAALWVAGAIVLYLRLVSRSVEISGHMAWLPLLTAQAFVLAFPRWFTAFGVAALVSAVWLKFAMFGGPSGTPGLVIGVMLAAVLIARERYRSG